MGGNKNYRRGASLENKIQNWFLDQAIPATRTPGSRKAFDVIIGGYPRMVLMQCKKGSMNERIYQESIDKMRPFLMDNRVCCLLHQSNDKIKNKCPIKIWLFDRCENYKRYISFDCLTEALQWVKQTMSAITAFDFYNDTIQ